MTSQPHQTSAVAAAAVATTAMRTPPAAEVPSVRRGRVTYLLFTSRDRVAWGGENFAQGRGRDVQGRKRKSWNVDGAYIIKSKL